MRVSLLWNPAAGDGVSLTRLRREIARAGHVLAHLAEPEDDLAPLADAELAVAAGGDGTVARLARTLAQRGGGTLGILPCGTANNVAGQLGIAGSLPELVGRWSRARRVPLDVGVARGAWGERLFLEAVGSGLVSRGIATMDAASDAHAEDESAADALARARATFRDVLERLVPQPARLSVDGAPLDGHFLLVEVLNVRATGPNLVLAPEASPSDGYFTVVTASEEHRPALAEYLRRRSEDCTAPHPELPARRAQRVDVEGWEELHLDDELRAGAEARRVSLRIRPGALRVLV
jgi:diacylglycerol kinase family enzyme